ncbi:MAG: polymorphic toxin type 50 domain-containing protein [Janthinobacterium lividum]
MKATVTYGDAPPEPLPDQLRSGWMRIPVSFQVTLPAEVMEHTRQGGSSVGSGHGSGASVSIVPHSLRLGTGRHPAGGAGATVNAAMTPTTRGKIHYGKDGAHIVPAPLHPPEPGDSKP